jgi:hypothetical protein
MGVMRGHTLRDKRGQALQVNVADCVNVGRTPKVREKILNGEFHRIKASGGNGPVSVEKPFFYADFERGQFFLVLPRWDRHKWREAAEDFHKVLGHLPESLAPADRRKVRLVFGLAELREKLLAFDAELNDRLVEVLKALILYEHPFLLESPRLNLVLDRVDTSAVEFIISYDHQPRRYRVGYRRRLVDDLFAREAECEQWLALLQGQTPAEPDHEHEPAWINLRRWSPSNWALAELDRLAQKVESKLPGGIDIDSDAFDKMLRFLPRGSELSAAAKRDLKSLRKWAANRQRRRNRRESLKEELWEIYFGKELTAERGMVKLELVEQLWGLLDGLSDAEIEGNSFIEEIRVGVPGGTSFYDPDTNDIGIDRASLPKGRPYDREWFEQVMLHEVGHAVHAKHQKQVDQMLMSLFGWERFPTTDAGIDGWIRAMGDYPETFGELQKRQVRSYIRQAVGNGERWTPPVRPRVPDGHPWNAEDFGPRLAFEGTVVRDNTKRWYDSHMNWYAVGDRRFFVNYYYGELMVVNEEAIQQVHAGALDCYALMAPPEFFAELYMTANAREPGLIQRRGSLAPKALRFLQSLEAEQPAEPELVPAG